MAASSSVCFTSLACDALCCVRAALDAGDAPDARNGGSWLWGARIQPGVPYPHCGLQRPPPCQSLAHVGSPSARRKIMMVACPQRKHARSVSWPARSQNNTTRFTSQRTLHMGARDVHACFMWRLRMGIISVGSVKGLREWGNEKGLNTRLGVSASCGVRCRQPRSSQSEQHLEAVHFWRARFL